VSAGRPAGVRRQPRRNISTIPYNAEPHADESRDYPVGRNLEDRGYDRIMELWTQAGPTHSKT
jgi:hypothetical protein